MNHLRLHIGLPKTGTSYIQQWLDRSRSVLAEDGIWVPAKQIHAQRLAVEFITDGRRAARRDCEVIRETALEAVLDELVAASADPAVTAGIISSEYFFESNPAEVKRLQEVVGNARITIVVYLRRQDRLLESSYNQEVKAMGLPRTLGPPRYFIKRDFFVLFDSWAREFGEKNVRVVNYDQAAASNNLLGTFCDAVGLPKSLLKRTGTDFIEAQNKSLPANLLEFKRLANAFGEFGLESWLNRAMEAGMSGPSYRFPPDVAREHLALYQESNEKLAHCLGLPDAESLFPTGDLDGDPAGVDFTGAIPAETVAQLLALYVKEAEYTNAALSARMTELERRIDQLTREAAHADHVAA